MGASFCQFHICRIVFWQASQSCISPGARCTNFDIPQPANNWRTLPMKVLCWCWKGGIVEISRHAGRNCEGGDTESSHDVQGWGQSSLPPTPQLTQSHSTLGAGRQLVTPQVSSLSNKLQIGQLAASWHQIDLILQPNQLSCNTSGLGLGLPVILGLPTFSYNYCFWQSICDPAIGITVWNWILSCLWSSLF